MSINERIKEYRKSQHLTQQEFANKIGVKRASVSWIEQDGNTVTEQNIKSICQAYGISERWLRDGVGEMMVAGQMDPLDDVAAKYHLSEIEQKIMRVYLQLDDEHRQSIVDFVSQLASELQPPASSIDAQVARETAEFAEQRRRELEQEAGISRSRSGDGDEENNA